MTTFKDREPGAIEPAASDTDSIRDSVSESPADDGRLTLAEILELLAGGRLPLRFTAYDGSSAGPEDAPFGLELTSPRGTTYLATARGDLGLARAYIAGDIEIHGVHPGDPYELLKALADDWCSGCRRRRRWPGSSGPSASSTCVRSPRPRRRCRRAGAASAPDDGTARPATPR